MSLEVIRDNLSLIFEGLKINEPYPNDNDNFHEDVINRKVQEFILNFPKENEKIICEVLTFIMYILK